MLANKLKGAVNTEPQFNFSLQTTISGTAANNFGFTVQVNADFIFIAEPTVYKVHVYSRSNFAFVTTITSANSYPITSMAVNSNYLFIGHENWTGSGNGSNDKVLCYEIGTWTYQWTLQAPTGTGKGFGLTVEATDSYLLVGSRRYNGSNYLGGAYLYNLNTSTFDWYYEPSTSTRYNYGQSMCINDTYFAVGAYFGGATFAGYVEVRDIATQTIQFTDTGTASYSYLGQGLAMYNNLFAYGAPHGGDCQSDLVDLNTMTKINTITAANTRIGAAHGITDNYYTVGFRDDYDRGYLKVYSLDDYSQVGSTLYNPATTSYPRGFGRSDTIQMHTNSTNVIMICSSYVDGKVYIYA